VNGETPVMDEFMDRLLRLEALLEAKDDAGIGSMLASLHPSDVADLVEELDERERVHILDLLPIDLASETLAEMEAEEHPEEILAALEPARISELIAELADDDAADLIGDLPPEEQARILGTLTPVDAGELRQLLQYPEESAGGIMTTEAVVVSVHLTAQQAITEVRRQARDIGPEFYSVFVVDLLRRLIGLVSIQDLALAEPDTPLRRLAVPPPAVVPVDLDQEDVGRLIARYNVPSLPVVGPDNVLLGRVTFDDVIDVMEAEQTEDILRLAGLGEEELRGTWYGAVRSRLPWLFVNLVTAIMAAFVVWIFQATISQIVILAVIMPIIAGMGGNAGTQALAVTVRRLALSEGGLPQWEVVGKELLVGLVNGAVLGVVVGVAGYLLESNATLGLVVLMAMWGNLLIASFAGGFIPILLERVGVDPAVASSIFVTTFTDLAGFFLLLGLATALMLP